MSYSPLPLRTMSKIYLAVLLLSFNALDSVGRQVEAKEHLPKRRT